MDELEQRLSQLRTGTEPLSPSPETLAGIHRALTDVALLPPGAAGKALPSPAHVAAGAKLGVGWLMALATVGLIGAGVATTMWPRPTPPLPHIAQPMTPVALAPAPVALPAAPTATVAPPQPAPTPAPVLGHHAPFAPPRERVSKLEPAVPVAPRPVAKGAETGSLRIATQPPATVNIDGREVGTTPMDPITLVAGRHRVELVSVDLGARLVRTVEVRSGETTRLQETMSFGQTEGAVPENLINPLDSSPSPPAPVPGGNTPSRAIRPPTSPSVQPDNLVSPF